MSFAQKIIHQAHLVNEDDFEELRQYGLSDEDILDIILASAARSFIRKTINAVGKKPDRSLIDLEADLLQLLNGLSTSVKFSGLT